jgi:hypothetical protein
MSTETPTIANPSTWKILENSRNQAATTVLLSGLNSTIPTVRHRCLKTLMVRQDQASFRSILLNWEHLDPEDRELLQTKAHKFVESSRLLLQDGTLQEKKLTLAAVSDLDLTDSTDILLEHVLDSNSSLRKAATECLVSMCERWGRESRRTGSLTGARRQQLIKKLYNSVLANTGNSELLDPWLAMIHWDDSQQRSLLSDPRHPAYIRMLDHFRVTTSSSAMQLLAGYLWRVTTPQGLQEIIQQKPDPQLAIEMALLVSDEVLPVVLERLRYSLPLACLANIDISTVKMEPVAYRRLQLMMAASREDIEWTLSTAVQLAKGSSLEARQQAADLIQWSRRPSLEQFVRMLQADSVRAVDQQKLKPLVDEMIRWLNSPSSILRQAANHILADFTLEELFKLVGVWPAQLCRIMAHVVKHKEKNIKNSLEEFLHNPSPKKRLAALQVAEWLQAGELVKDRLISMLEDPRLEVRVQLIDTLSSLSDSTLDNIMPRLLEDASTDIVDAARRASRRMERQRTVTS